MREMVANVEGPWGNVWAASVVDASKDSILFAIPDADVSAILSLIVQAPNPLFAETDLPG
jgi:hypothetical protein